MGAMNELINAGSVETLTRILAASAPEIRWDRTAGTASGLDHLVLRARTDLLAAALVADIAGSPSPGYPTAAASFRTALQVPEFTGWFLWPVSEAAVTLALASGAAGDFDDCLALLAALTPRLTGEFAVRRLLASEPDRALAAAREWANSPDEHVRRLASEGTRPYLPWAIRLPALLQRPQATIPILDALYRDPSEYVRRSVANHLNDLARHAPVPVLDTARRWLAAPDANTERLVRHGLRTLVKKGHPDALGLLGFTSGQVDISGPRLDRDVLTLPDELTFTFAVTNTGPEDVRLALDYRVHYLKADGRQSAKVFKISTVTLAPGETRRVTKRHAFRQMTTRVHYAGTHALELQINGVTHGRTEFLLKLP